MKTKNKLTLGSELDSTPLSVFSRVMKPPQELFPMFDRMLLCEGCNKLVSVVGGTRIEGCMLVFKETIKSPPSVTIRSATFSSSC